MPRSRMTLPKRSKSALALSANSAGDIGEENGGREAVTGRAVRQTWMLGGAGGQQGGPQHIGGQVGGEGLQSL